MAIDINLIKSFGKQGIKALLTILFFTGAGIISNWILLAFLTPELKILFDTTGSHGGHAGGGAAILAVLLLLFVNWKVTLLFTLFFFVFPFVHFLFAKKYAISVAISSILKEKKEHIVEYLMQKFFDRIHSKMEWLDKMNNSGLVKAVNEYLPQYINKLEGMPFVIRVIVKLFLSRLDFMGIVSGAISDEGKIDISQEELIQKITNKVNLVLDEKVFSPSLQGNLIVFTINLLTFILAKTLI